MGMPKSCGFDFFFANHHLKCTFYAIKMHFIGKDVGTFSIAHKQ